MHKVLAGSVALALVAGGQVMASDMPLKAPVYKAAPVPYSWAGLYVGANIGYAVGRDPSSLNNGFFTATTPPTVYGESFTGQPSGIFGGLQAGYNWQAGNWVLGGETDLQASSQRDSVCIFVRCNPNQAPPITVETATIQQKSNWFGTTRGRAGYADGPVLTYVTAGVAYGNTQTNITGAFGPGGAPALRIVSRGVV